MTFKFNLGDEVKDAVSGYTGVITARIEYLTGCARYQVQNQELSKDGEPAKSHVFDEHILTLIQAGKIQIANAAPQVEGELPRKGGPEEAFDFEAKL